MLMRELLVKFRGNRSQAEMGKLYGVSQQAWSQYESGENAPRPALMAKIADDAKMDMRDIFFDIFQQDKLVISAKK